jgi:clan AA aspartic protease (TIGR02281 family)
MRDYLCLTGVAFILFMSACAPASAQTSDLGDKPRQGFEKYYYGNGVPKNQARAEQYLNEAAQYGSEWAILLLAQEQEKLAPEKALEAYLRLARNDNCIAQMRLADAYASGVLVKKNLTQAYFWLLLAKVNEWVRKADVNYNGPGRIGYEAGYKKQCGMAALSLFPLQVQIEGHKRLPAILMQVAQDAATNWIKGETEKLLPAPVITVTQAVPPDARSKAPPKAGTITPPLVPEAPAKLAEKQNRSSRAEVSLKKDGGIFVVPVEINGTITLDFAIDSGAADVSVPADVFSTLVRTGTIKDSDIIGEQTYVLADGSKSQSVTFTIRSLKVGDKVVENVRASVASVQGTLLLGQSFLERFKSWSLDNNKHELLLEPQ